jgi:hypothetical protein
MTGALVGMALRRVLPKHHLSQESLDVIKLATGLMATLAALVLGLLISSASTTHNTIKSEYIHSLASVVLLDRYLAAYGSEAQDARIMMRHLVVSRFQVHWPEDDFGPKEPPPSANGSDLVDLEQRIIRLQPRDDAQKWFQSQALQLANGLAEVQWLVLSQEVGDSLPLPMLIILVAWSTAIFVSFGLFVKPNPTIIVALSISALAVAGAMFLIMELNSPFTGLIKISSAPAHAALAVIGK